MLSANTQLHLWVQSGHEPNESEMDAVKDADMLISTNHDIQTFPAWLCRLPKLKTIEFSGSPRLSAPPPEIGSMPSLRELLLFGCKSLQSIPDTIGDLKHLEVLSLINSGVKALPESITRASNLKKLYLGGCRSLQSLPENMQALAKLEELDVSKTGIECLPVSVTCLEHLRMLHARKCANLSVVPDDLGRVATGLNFVDLSNTAISKIPSGLLLRKGLEHLDVSGCKKLKEVPLQIHSLKLKTLDLSDTGVTTLEEFALANYRRKTIKLQNE